MHFFCFLNSFSFLSLLANCIMWKWQPTPVLMPGKSYGWWNLVGYSPWGHKESDTTERLHFTCCGKEPACQCRRLKRLRFNPWVGKMSWGRAWQPTPVFLLGESPWIEEPCRLQSWGRKELDAWLQVETYSAWALGLEISCEAQVT